MAEKNDKSTREKAAEARAAAQAAERRRERMIRIIGGLAVLAVVGIIIAIGVVNRGGDSGGGSDTPSADSPLPNGITAENGYGFQVNTAADKPDVVIFEDFQCPACAQFEQAYGPLIQQEAADGNIQLTYRIMTFLDNNLNTDHSVRAANAFGCSINAGVGEAYHNAIYANQPANEGAGWTDDQLKQFGTDVGITGEAKTTFDQCVDEGTYKGWAGLSNQAAFDSGVTGTPTVEVNGQKIPDSALASEQALREALTNPQQ
jgi:protein-disulfide isomerase